MCVYVCVCVVSFFFQVIWTNTNVKYVLSQTITVVDLLECGQLGQSRQLSYLGHSGTISKHSETKIQSASVCNRCLDQINIDS